MKTIPVSKFGRDHWSLLAYIETLRVDRRGYPDLDRMRCNRNRHPGLVGMVGFGWTTLNSTRLFGHSESKPKRRAGHDDHDCARDLEAAGFITIKGTGINPVFQMTPQGAALTAAIRAHKQNGGTFSNFMQ